MQSRHFSRMNQDDISSGLRQSTPFLREAMGTSHVFTVSNNSSCVPSEIEAMYAGNYSSCWMARDARQYCAVNGNLSRTLGGAGYSYALNNNSTMMASETEHSLAANNNLWIPSERGHTVAANENFYISSEAEHFHPAKSKSFSLPNEPRCTFAANDNSWIPSETRPSETKNAYISVNNSFLISRETGRAYAVNNNTHWPSSETRNTTSHNPSITTETGHTYSHDDTTCCGSLENESLSWISNQTGQYPTRIEDFFSRRNICAPSTPFHNISRNIQNQMTRDSQELPHGKERATHLSQSLTSHCTLQARKVEASEPEETSKRHGDFACTQDPIMTAPITYDPYSLLINRTLHFYPSVGNIFLKNNAVKTFQCWSHTYAHEGYNILACLNFTFTNKRRLYFLTVLDIGHIESERRCKYEASLLGPSEALRYIGRCHTMKQTPWDIVVKNDCLLFSATKAMHLETIHQGEDGTTRKGFKIMIDLITY